MSIVIFDFDGTIADSFETVLKITNRLAIDFGLKPVSPEEVPRLQNLSSREIVKESKISFFKLALLLRRLQKELNGEIGQLMPIPGIKEALICLKQQGHDLGIVTSNSRANVTAFLENHGIKELFSFIQSGSSLFGKGQVINRILKRHRLDPYNVIYVGDETRDIEAAKKIRIKVIAVSWGFNSGQALIAARPDFLVQQPDELMQVIGNL